jgi:EmrB/QacA subfamily drug resistance transporter
MPLKPKQLADGVYALLADKLPRNNHGLVVGRDAALLVDAGINPAIAQHLQQVARRLTDRPIRYLVNTVYHGDHTFGNAAFPPSTQIVASRQTAASVTDLDYERRAQVRNLFGNLDAIAEVTKWRTPDLLFDDHMELDLDGRVVHLWHFGPGNSPGDTVAWVPEARATWTGNLLSNQRALTMLLEIPSAPYLDTLARFKNTLDVATIVPGHGPLAGPQALDRLMAYLRWLLGEVRQAMDLHLTALATIETVHLPREFRIPRWHPAHRIAPLVEDFHRPPTASCRTPTSPHPSGDTTSEAAMTGPRDQTRPGELRYRQSAGRWVLLATVLGSGLAFLDATVVNVALPRIGATFHAHAAALQWTVNGYSLSLASLILLGGSLGDRFGRRRIFVIGVVWFAAGSLLCGLAPGIPALIAARVLQGVGGALLTPGSLAIVEASFHPQDRAKAVGAWSGLSGVAGALGPLLSGWLVQTASWRLVFLINVPLAALVAIVSLRHVPESRDPQPAGGMDLAGTITAATSLAGLAYGFTAWPALGPTSSRVLAALTVGVAGMLAFLLTEHRSPHPMLPLEIFANKAFTAANLVTFTVYAALGGVFFLVVLNLQVVAGFSPVPAGAALLPATLLMLALSARAGALAQRIGPRLPITIGPIVCAAAMVGLARIGAHPR